MKYPEKFRLCELKTLSGLWIPEPILNVSTLITFIEYYLTLMMRGYVEAVEKLVENRTGSTVSLNYSGLVFSR